MLLLNIMLTFININILHSLKLMTMWHMSLRFIKDLTSIVVINRLKFSSKLQGWFEPVLIKIQNWLKPSLGTRQWPSGSREDGNVIKVCTDRHIYRQTTGIRKAYLGLGVLLGVKRDLNS